MADTSIGKAYVQIVPTAKGISNDIESMLGNEVGDSGDKAGLSFGKRMIGALGKLGVAAAVGKLFKDSIAEGANLQQSFGGLETLYGDAADQAKEYAYEAAKAGISANDYAEQAVSFGASLKAAFGGDTAKAVEAANTAIMDMTDNAAKMGTPIESIQAAYQGFAKGQYQLLDNLKIGYGGTKGEMERLLADASKLSGVEYNIDNLGDVYEAIHVIQEDLGLTGVAADEAATTFSGSFGAMQASAKNLLADLALGEAIGPDIKALGESIKTFVTGNLLPMVGNIASQIPEILASLPSFIGDMIPEIITVGAEIVANLAQSIIDNIPEFVAGVGTMFGKIWDFVTTIDWGEIGSSIVSLLGSAWDSLVETAGIVWDGVVAVFTSLIDFPDLAAGAEEVWNALTTTASTIWDTVVGLFTGEITWPDIAAAAEGVWVGLVSKASAIWEAFKGWFTKTFNFPSLDEFASAAWDTLSGIAQTVWDAVVAIFTGTIEFLSLDDLASAAWGTLEGIASGIWDLIKGAFGASDVTFADLTEIATSAWAGLVTLAGSFWDSIKGIFGKTDVVFSALDEFATTAWAGLVSLAGSFWDSIKGIFGKKDVVFSTLSDLAEKAWNGLTTTAGNIWDAVKGIFVWPEDFQWPDFGQLISGALDGLKKAAQGAWDWIMGLFGGGGEEEAVKSVQGSTTEMATALADAKLQINDVDISSIQLANEHVKNTALSWIRIFDNLKLKIPIVDVTALSSTLRSVKAYAENYKSAMNFSWTLPSLHGHLPIISVAMRSASSSDGRTHVSYPELSVSGFRWFKDGGIFDSPQIIGIGDSKGPEAAVPLDQMWKRMSAEFDKHSTGGATVNNYFTVDGAQDPEAWAVGAARMIKRELRMA